MAARALLAVTAALRLPPLVCVHGAGGGGWEYDVWKPVAKQEGVPAFVAPDLVPTRGDYAQTTWADYASQVQAWTKEAAKGTPRPVLVGASMGGLLALCSAPVVRPSAILLINSVPPRGVQTKPRPPADYPSVVQWANGSVKDTRDALPDGDEKTVQWAAPKWRDESGQVMNDMASGIAAVKPTCPVLCILGTADTDVSYATGLALAAWSKADIHAYNGMSHIGPLMGKRAESVARAAFAWLRDTIK